MWLMMISEIFLHFNNVFQSCSLSNFISNKFTQYDEHPYVTNSGRASLTFSRIFTCFRLLSLSVQTAHTIFPNFFHTPLLLREQSQHKIKQFFVSFTIHTFKKKRYFATMDTCSNNWIIFLLGHTSCSRAIVKSSSGTVVVFIIFTTSDHHFFYFRSSTVEKAPRQQIRTSIPWPKNSDPIMSLYCVLDATLEAMLLALKNLAIFEFNKVFCSSVVLNVKSAMEDCLRLRYIFWVYS